MSNAKDVLKVTGTVVDSLDVIQGFTGVGGPGADAALAAIGKIVGMLQEGLAGKTSPEIVAADLREWRAHLDVLTNAIDDKNAEIDERARHKFDVSDENGDPP